MSASGPEGRITCRVVTPEAERLRQTADAVVFPAFDGQMGILADHAPMVALVGLGEMRVRLGNDVRRLAVDGGLVTVKHNEVTVIANRALNAEALERDRISAEIKELQARRPGEDAQALKEWKHAMAWSRLCDRLAEHGDP